MKYSKKKKNENEEEEVKWVKHYSSDHHILLVGEGDFSFSSSLAQSFSSASNIVATSLDSYDSVVKKYRKAKSNLENLLKLGGATLHGVDSTKMKLHADLKMRKFDRIIFNFPHAGFHGKEDSVWLIEKHKKLVLGFFRKASGMLRDFGEIHVTHKTSGPFRRWNIEELARRNNLLLIECADFKLSDYLGYNNKRGDGKRCNEPFPLGQCSTFKFRFPPCLKKSKEKCSSRFTRKKSKCHQDIPIQPQHLPTPLHCGHPETGSNRDVSDFMLAPLAFRKESVRGLHKDVEYSRNRVQAYNYESFRAETYGRSPYFENSDFEMNSVDDCHREEDKDYFANQAKRYYERYVAEASRRSQDIHDNSFRMRHQRSANVCMPYVRECDHTCHRRCDQRNVLGTSRRSHHYKSFRC